MDNFETRYLKILLSAATFLVVILLLAGLYVPLAHADNLGFGDSYDTLEWWTVDGGGGILSSEIYLLEGTIGQPDSAKIINGSYTLMGGFLQDLSLEPSLFLPLVVK